MKFTYYVVITFLLLAIACENAGNEPLHADESSMVGKWTLTEAYISAGGPQYWVDVENGEEIIFSENGTFSSNRYTECAKGNFSIEDKTLLLDYDCNGFSTESENEEGLLTFTLEFYSDYFILIPTSGPICIEGCSYKYQK